MKKFVERKYRKSLLASSIFLLGIVTHQSNAAPITGLPSQIQSQIPGSAHSEYNSQCNNCTVSGIYVWDYAYGSTIPIFGDNVTINGGTQQSLQHAVYINGSATGTSVGAIFGDRLTITTSVNDADGLRTMGNGTNQNDRAFIITGDYTSITTTGSSADGINAGYTARTQGYNGSAYISLGNYARIETSGTGAYGISANALYDDRYNDIILGNDATIITHGSSSYAIRAGGLNSNIELGDRASIFTDGSFAYSIYSSKGSVSLGTESQITTTGNSAHGVYATSNGIVNLGEKAQITTSGNTAHGVYATSSGNITIGKNATISANTNGTATGAINTVYANSSSYSPNSTITLEGGATIYNGGSKATNSYAINSVGSGSKIDGSTAGIYKITGDINATTGGTIDLNMASTSLWTGASYLDATSTTNLTMANNSVWNMTGSSKVTSLNSNGTVNFQSSAGNYYTLTTGSLSGNGTFGMKVDMVGQQGDLIDVTDTNVSGNHKLTIANNGAVNTDGTEVLTVVKTLDNTQGSFTSNTVEVGAYEYQLRQKSDGKEWELYGSPRGPGNRTTTADASVNLLNANYLLSYIDNQTLLQRMGQLRASNNQQGDFWMRGFGGKLNSFGGSTSGFDMSYKGTQLGIDKLIKTNNGRLYVGGMVGFTDADPNYRGGHGTTKDYHFGLYSTYITDNDFYIDGVLKYTHMKNRFNVKDTLGDTVTGKGNSEGYSASLEAGKRFYLSQAKGYYIEPQAQITHGYQGGMTINGSNGLKTKLSNYNFTLGRASTLVGYTIDSANPVDIYFKTGYVREFDGKTSYKFNQGNKINHSFKGGWWDNGIGVNTQINGKHNIYAEVDYAKGSRFDQKQLNLGYRYSF